MRLFYALGGYSSVHWVSGRWGRALAWDALLILSLVFIFRLPMWLFVLPHFAQAIDAALLEPKRSRTDGAYSAGTVIAMCAALAVAVTTRVVWAEAFKIPSGGMIPTLQVGDHMFIAKQARTPGRGDVIVFIYPKEPDKDFVKRVVAVGGDTIEIRDEQLVINGTPVPRQHVDAPCEYDDFVEDSGRWETRRCEAWDETLDGHTYRVVYDYAGARHSFAPRTVPPGHYFVMGDNRDNSHDSRYWGYVPPENVKGTARKIWWSAGQHGVRWDRMEKPIR
jgi:signal peptidase I